MDITRKCTAGGGYLTKTIAGDYLAQEDEPNYIANKIIEKKKRHVSFDMVRVDPWCYGLYTDEYFMLNFIPDDNGKCIISLNGHDLEVSVGTDSDFCHMYDEDSGAGMWLSMTRITTSDSSIAETLRISAEIYEELMPTLGIEQYSKESATLHVEFDCYEIIPASVEYVDIPWRSIADVRRYSDQNTWNSSLTFTFSISELGESAYASESIKDTFLIPMMYNTIPEVQGTITWPSGESDRVMFASDGVLLDRSKYSGYFVDYHYPNISIQLYITLDGAVKLSLYLNQSAEVTEQRKEIFDKYIPLDISGEVTLKLTIPYEYGIHLCEASDVATVAALTGLVKGFDRMYYICYILAKFKQGMNCYTPWGKIVRGKYCGVSDDIYHVILGFIKDNNEVGLIEYYEFKGDWFSISSITRVYPEETYITSESGKTFKLIVDDNGTLTTEEVE